MWPDELTKSLDGLLSHVIKWVLISAVVIGGAGVGIGYLMFH